MTRYYAAKFEKVIPQGDGVRIHSAVENYALISIDDGVDYPYIEDVPHVELTADEVNIGRLYYGECRTYRKAYSDSENLMPDADELAKGRQKTKVYKTDHDTEVTISLMKKIAARLVIDEFDTREDRSGEQALLDEIESLASIEDICLFKEAKFGLEIPWPLARTLNLIDESSGYPHRINPPTYGVKF